MVQIITTRRVCEQSFLNSPGAADGGACAAAGASARTRRASLASDRPSSFEHKQCKVSVRRAKREEPAKGANRCELWSFR